jgi:hypothetical protein
MLTKIIAAVGTTAGSFAVGASGAAASIALGRAAFNFCQARDLRRANTALEAQMIIAPPLCAVENDPIEHAIDDRVRRQAGWYRGVPESTLAPVRIRPLDAAERSDAARWRDANPGHPDLW